MREITGRGEGAARSGKRERGKWREVEGSGPAAGHAWRKTRVERRPGRLTKVRVVNEDVESELNRRW